MKWPELVSNAMCFLLKGDSRVKVLSQGERLTWDLLVPSFKFLECSTFPERGAGAFGKQYEELRGTVTFLPSTLFPMVPRSGFHRAGW